MLLWIVAPLIDRWISEPIKPSVEPLNGDQVSLFRQVARRTWGFFERFVGPEDHWLPPDHFQEQPVGIIAHHTSPSNIGLLFTSTLAAYDLGYLDQLGLASRISITMDTLNQLERFRGHFLNWYDTLTLQPLTPRYISTVDSGNLAACLIITAQACRKMPRERIFRWSLWQGYLDTLASIKAILKGVQKSDSSTVTSQIEGMIGKMQAEILAVRGEPFKWYALFLTVTGQFWPDVSGRLITLLMSGGSGLDLEALRNLQEVSSQVVRQHQAIRRTLSELVPWIQFLEQLPSILLAAAFQGEVDELRTNLPYNPRLADFDSHLNAAQAGIAALRLALKDRTIPAHDPGFIRAGQDWLEALEGAIIQAGANANGLMEIYTDCAERAERLVAEMDFRFLYHPQRRVFHNGFNLDTGQLDNNYYDILASEARIASIIALAKGEVPQSHWLQLSRPITQVGDRYVLLSWSATMFEYLMPPLFLRSYPGTLLSDSAQGAVLQQVAYAKTRGVPWGISEAGFYLFDANQNYQYRAFGIPGLGFKRGLGDDLVVAPYASLMAIGYDPQAVAHNIESLLKQGCFGLYGLYESIDFSLSRVPTGSQSAVVHEYMSHHQGMILMSLANHFNADIMVRRMHSDPRIQSVELLLQEQIPQSVPLQNPHAEEVKGLARLTDLPAKIDPWSVPLQTAIPLVTLLSNGSYGVLLSNTGGGYSTWRDTDLTRWQADGVLDPWGSWVYIQELPQAGEVGESGANLWSAGYQPIPGKSENVQVTFFPHMAVFRRTVNDITPPPWKLPSAPTTRWRFAVFTCTTPAESRAASGSPPMAR
jgi:cyclic beta-1,2-glucan synthetase